MDEKTYIQFMDEKLCTQMKNLKKWKKIEKLGKKLELKKMQQVWVGLKLAL